MLPAIDLPLSMFIHVSTEPSVNVYDAIYLTLL